MTDTFKDIRTEMPDGLWLDGRFYPISKETVAALEALAPVVATMRAHRPEPRAE